MNSVATGADGAPIPISDVPVLRIEPPGRWWVLPIAEIWDYRELMYFFVWRELKVRYKQTAVGAAWAVLQPLLTMLIFSLFFGEAGSHSIRRSSLPDFLLQRVAAVDVFCSFAAECNEQDCRKSKCNHQGLFPAVDSANLSDVIRPSGFRDFVSDVCRHHVLLPHSSRLARC